MHEQTEELEEIAEEAAEEVQSQADELVAADDGPA